MCNQGKIIRGSTCIFAAAIFALILSSFVCRGNERKTSGGIVAAADTCDNPDANIECNFTDFPLNPGNVMKLTNDSEPGTRIIIRGTITDKSSGGPISGVKIYAYQTDNSGHYSKSGTETGIG